MEKSWLDTLIENSINSKGVNTNKLTGFIEDVETLLFIQSTLSKAGIKFDIKLKNKIKKIKVVDKETPKKVTNKETSKRRRTKKTSV